MNQDTNKSEKIIIPIIIQSLNQTLRQHWGAKSRTKKEYKVLIRNQMRLNRIKKTDVAVRWNVTITSYRKKLLDKDNLIGGAKSLLDSLCDEGFIFDDTPDMVSVRYYQKISKSKEYYTEITRSR